MAIPIFVLSFVICYAISSLLMGSAVSPLVRLLREEWVARDDTPIPTALLGPVDVIKAESGKIAICILLGAVLLVKTILAR